MTRRERLEKAISLHTDGIFEAPDPAENQFGFIKAAIRAGHLEPGNLRSYATVLRRIKPPTLPRNEDSEHEEPSTPLRPPARPYSTRHGITEGEDGDRHYIFYAKSPFYISEVVVEEMKRAYANRPNGLGWTINQVCKHFKIGRREFQFIRQELGWTHDQDEFTREEHLELDTKTLLEDREQRSRWLLEQEAKKVHLLEMERKAKQWDTAVARYFGDQNHTVDLSVEPERDKAWLGQRLAVIPLADWHIEDQVDAEAKLKELQGLVNSVKYKGADRALLVFLGDWFHYDTFGKTTTRGTLVGDGDPVEMVRTAYSAARKAVEIVKKAFSSLDCVVVAGNHDRMQTIGFAVWLEELLGKQPIGLVPVAGLEMACVKFGNNQILFEHGDGGRGKIENIIMKATSIWGADPRERRFLYTGHLHHAKMLDVAGVLCFQLSTIKSKKHNHWEEKAGYHSQEGVRADIYEAKGGLETTFWRWT